jgi:putative addiction module killer protein
MSNKKALKVKLKCLMSKPPVTGYTSKQEGVCELRIHYGPEIRIYYGKIGNKIILLLCGGDKGYQDRDIAKAKEYLKDYQSREIGHGKK